MAAKNDAIGARAAGISAYRTQLVTFAVGSGLGAVAGGINAYVISYVNPSAINVDLSFLFLAMVVLGGAGSRVGPIVGAAVLGGLPIWLAKYPNANVLVYALVLLVIVRLRPRGLIGQTAVRLGRVRHGRGHAPTAEAPAAAPAEVGTTPIIACREVTKTFGGLVAVRDVSLELAPGSIVAIVGPNGSGKTTLLNMLSGYYAPTSGSIEIAGRPISRVRRGLVARQAASRTFQTPRIFGDLSPAEHLRLATTYAIATRDAGARAEFEALGASLCRELGVPMERAERAATLSHGQLRFLEIAFAIARGPRVLLLDEPATGLAASEIDLLCQAMRSVVSLGCTVVLVEHHLEMVSAIADHVVVLNLGSVLWQGAPADLANSEIVRDTYLGVSV
jgi:branched-chain amino acid transport system permease protein